MALTPVCLSPRPQPWWDHPFPGEPQVMPALLQEHEGLSQGLVGPAQRCQDSGAAGGGHARVLLLEVVGRGQANWSL